MTSLPSGPLRGDRNGPPNPGISAFAGLAYKADHSATVARAQNFHLASRHLCVGFNHSRVAGADQHLHIVTARSHVLHRFPYLDQGLLLVMTSHINLHILPPSIFLFIVQPPSELACYSSSPESEPFLCTRHTNPRVLYSKRNNLGD